MHVMENSRCSILKFTTGISELMTKVTHYGFLKGNTRFKDLVYVHSLAFSVFCIIFQTFIFYVDNCKMRQKNMFYIISYIQWTLKNSKYFYLFDDIR